MNKNLKIAKDLVKLAKFLIVAEDSEKDEETSNFKNEAVKDMKKTFNLKNKSIKNVVDKQTLQNNGVSLTKQVKDLKVQDLYKILESIARK